MDQTLMLRYAGRAAGAAAAYYTVGRKMSAVGAAVAVAAGWLAGGFLADRFLVPPQA